MGVLVTRELDGLHIKFSIEFSPWGIGFEVEMYGAGSGNIYLVRRDLNLGMVGFVTGGWLRATFAVGERSGPWAGSEARLRRLILEDSGSRRRWPLRTLLPLFWGGGSGNHDGGCEVDASLNVMRISI
jgi:hypothetical protein